MRIVAANRDARGAISRRAATRAMFLPIDHARALAPEAAAFVADGAADALAHERLRALNAARAACASAGASADADAGRRAHERYADAIAEAASALEARRGGADGATTRWASTLEGGRAAKSYPAPGLRGEEAFALFGLASCRRRMCAREAAARMADGGLGDAGAASCSKNARIAAGVFEHLRRTVLPPLRGLLDGECVANELTASMAEVMKLISLGDAQGAACRRALERGSAANLRARLHRGASELYRDANAVLQSRRCDWNGVDILLTASVLVAWKTHEAEAFLAHAEARRAADECGETIAACRRAQEAVLDCAQASREIVAWATYHDELASRVAALAAKARKENEVVFFQKIPTPGAPLPEAAVVVGPIEYVPSEPAKHTFFQS